MLNPHTFSGEPDLGYNVTLVGISLGGERIRYFNEFNAGCKSMLTAGLLVRF